MEDTFPEDVPDRSEWHEVDILEDGTRIGKRGAFWHIIDDDDCAISLGYHDISVVEGNKYLGKRGSTYENVERLG